MGFHVMYCGGRAPGHSGGMLCLQSAASQVTFAVGRKTNTLTLHNAFEAHFSGTCVCYMVAVLRGFSLFFPAIFFAVFSLFIIIIIKNEVISNYGCVCVFIFFCFNVNDNNKTG